MSRPPLTPRQVVILTQVIDSYISSGHPVGSKTLVELGAVEASPSTVRYELAELEALGFLDHPHTSAGRVPTDAGYRLYAESLLEQPLAPAVLPVDLSSVRSEVDTALRITTEMLSQVTSLVALVTAPPLEATEIRHIEVLLLQPQVVMVVIITATGGVTKRIFPFPGVVDPMLAEWANAFLNEQLTGVRLGGRTLVTRLDEPGLSATERAFLDALRPAFTELVDAAEQQLYVGGGARLLEEMHFADLAEINDLVRVLEGRVGLLGDAPRGARFAAPVPANRHRPHGAVHARPGDGRRQLRARDPEPGHGLADRPATDGLRGRDPVGARRRARAVGVRGRGV